jgi:hypothetical protein
MIMQKKLPGSTLSSTSSLDVSPYAVSPVRAARSPRQKLVHRATSPVALPGVEILIDGKPYAPTSTLVLPSAGSHLKMHGLESALST